MSKTAIESGGSRRMMIAGNWKLNKTVAESVSLVEGLLQRLGSEAQQGCDLVVAPPYTALHAVGQLLARHTHGAAGKPGAAPLGLAGQELYFEEAGAYTGAVSGALLKDVGCGYVLVGHSERRQLFGETLESSNKRVKAALAAGLQPIVCVGETLEEREAGRTTEVVTAQLAAAWDGLDKAQLSQLVLAYEPVWAIGTGKVATPEQAQEVHATVRAQLGDLNGGVAATMQILYGGSVKPNNAADLLSQADIDGALVGGASLDADAFAAIVAAR